MRFPALGVAPVLRRLAIACAFLVASAVVYIFPAAAQSVTEKGRGITPTFSDIAYAPAAPAASTGHLPDLYVPKTARNGKAAPIVIWTGGSGWRGEQGKDTAGEIAERLVPVGLAVAGVSIRSSDHVQFPGQLHDIKAAIRWLRANANRYRLDPDHIGIMGGSSGGWTAAIAATTGDVPELEGNIGTTGVSSAVQVAIAFYPPTDFLIMDRGMPYSCAPMALAKDPKRFCHDPPSSPESLLIGCPIQTCQEKARAADPSSYVSDEDPPIMIFHGEADQAVPHNQGEHLFQVLLGRCARATFISLPLAGHDRLENFLMLDETRAGATIRISSPECTAALPQLYRPDWNTVIDFLRRNLSQ